MGNFHDDVPTVHATSACPDYGSPADDGSASAYADYGSPAVHATSACPDYGSPADDGSAGTNHHDERCFFRNQHNQRCFFRNIEGACLVTQKRDNASCKVPRLVQGDEPPPAAFSSTTRASASRSHIYI